MMESKFSKILKLLVSLALVTSIVFSGYGGLVSVAEGEVTSKERFVGKETTTIDGKNYVLAQSKFMLNYEIKNNTEKNITQIILNETLLDEDGSIISEVRTPISDSNINGGGEKTLRGNEFSAKEKVTTYTLEYLVQYTLEGENEIRTIPGGKKKITVLSTEVNITYKASSRGPIPQGNSVTYTFDIESLANITIENILVRDSALGDLGVIASLKPGSSASIYKDFKLHETTKGYPILIFDDPMGSQEKKVREFTNAAIEVEVEIEQVEKPLVILGKASKSRISPGESVDFSLIVENKGNRTLNDVKLTNWDGKEILTRQHLAPGKEGTVIYTERVEPGKEYTFKAVAVEEGTGRKVQAVYTEKFTPVEAGLEIVSKVIPEEIASGDMITIEYTLKNTGKVTMVDILIQEPEFGQVGDFSELQPGQVETFSIEKVIDEDTSSHPKVYAKGKDTGHGYEFQGALVEIAINVVESNPLLTIRLTSEPETLTEPGTVDLVCTVINEGDVKIDNIELVLNERQLNIGSILTLESGDEETITLPGLDIEEDSSFTVTAKGITYQGEKVEFLSDAYEIQIGGDVPEEPIKNPKLNFLKKLLWIIATLVIATAGGIVFLIRDLKRGDKAKIRIKRKGANQKTRRK